MWRIGRRWQNRRSKNIGVEEKSPNEDSNRGGTPEKPVGLVFVALALPDGSMTIRRLDWPGSRDVIQRRAVVAALSMLWRALR